MENKIKKGKYRKPWFLINKKGQIKIQEMAFVLVAVVFLFALLFLFFARFQTAQLQKMASEIRELRTVTMLRVVASLPELRCSSSFGTATETACIDKDKLKAFDENSYLRDNYKNIWQEASISKVIVEEIYGGGQKYTVYSKLTQESTITYSTYIPLCEETDARESKCVVAKIKITTIMP
ncbi:MAG: hypothetical protein IB618_03865 [Candidatus Pacearchaeota archaeon]|nr:MAG: hypothetical protein IB618_03865 [Candidatus Pacearchaeota archaeon]